MLEQAATNSSAMLEQAATNSLTATTKSSSSSNNNNKEEDSRISLEPELRRRPWSDLPDLVLEQISNKLAILELLSFRGSCREWRRLGTHHSKPESSSISYREPPWFLLYGKHDDEYPNCNLYDPSSKRIYSKFNIPALGGEGVTCLASKGGWLLLYKNSDRSLFFLCPFSGARIDLPNKLPYLRYEESLVFNRIAAFTSTPTSPDCIVCVCTQTWSTSDGIKDPLLASSKFEVHVLRRGANEWETDQPEFVTPFPPPCTKAFSAAFWRGTVYFITPYWSAVIFSLETKQWKEEISSSSWERVYRLIRRRKQLDKGIFGLKDIDSLSICGMEMQGYNGFYSDDKITSVWNEEIKGVVDVEDGKEYKKENKGVWIQPRFFQLPPNYSCSKRLLLESAMSEQAATNSSAMLEQAATNSSAMLEQAATNSLTATTKSSSNNNSKEDSRILLERDQPWFLLYGKHDEYPNCDVYEPSSKSKRIYSKINIPALGGEGVTCLASKGGWLLLYRNSDRSLFFLCPFSGARIDLPNKLPYLRYEESLVFNRIAAFTSTPTSPDCIVCVCTQTRCSDNDIGVSLLAWSRFELHVLRRGANEWETQPEFVNHFPAPWSKPVSAAFWRGTVYFITPYRSAVLFSLETKQWSQNMREWKHVYRVVRPDKQLDRGIFGLKDIDSLSICGMEMQGNGFDSDDKITSIWNEDDKIPSIWNEEIKGVVDKGKGIIMKHFRRLLHLDDPAVKKEYKGVWIQPRLFQLPPNYSWWLDTNMSYLSTTFRWPEFDMSNLTRWPSFSESGLFRWPNFN